VLIGRTTTQTLAFGSVTLPRTDGRCSTREPLVGDTIVNGSELVIAVVFVSTVAGGAAVDVDDAFVSDVARSAARSHAMSKPNNSKHATVAVDLILISFA
jgi:hypothetical protein